MRKIPAAAAEDAHQSEKDEKTSGGQIGEAPEKDPKTEQHRTKSFSARGTTKREGAGRGAMSVGQFQKIPEVRSSVTTP